LPLQCLKVCFQAINIFPCPQIAQAGLNNIKTEINEIDSKIVRLLKININKQATDIADKQFSIA